MKRTGFGALSCALILTIGCTADRRGEVDGDRTAELRPADGPVPVGTSGELEQEHGSSADARHFAQQAGTAGLTEVTLGKLAQERAQSAPVKAFADMMVRDHSKSGAELKQIVSRYNVDMPTTLDAEHQQLFDRLKALKGAEFEREYMKAMVDGHKKVKSLIASRVENTAAHRDAHGATGTSGTAAADTKLDAGVNQWAASSLPRVSHHLEQAESISAQLK
jgi:putative membrane protein